MRVRRLLSRVWFRLGVAALFLIIHVRTVADFAKEHFEQPFNAAPDSPPTFRDAAHDGHATNAKRLVVSRWDAEHYIAIGLRGYTQCPTGPLTRDDIRQIDPHCNL